MPHAKRYNLPSLFEQAIVLDINKGMQLAEAGMNLAVESADKKEKDWSKRCWQLCEEWLRRKPNGFEFMIENFRVYLYQYDLIEKPPSERSYGFLSSRIIKEGWAEMIGDGRTSNVKTHGAKAGVYRKR